MSYTLIHEPEFIDDLEALWLDNEDAAAEIEAMLEEIGGSQDLMDRLSQDGYPRYGSARFEIKYIRSQAAKKRNIWRMSFLGLPKTPAYRVIYAYNPTKKHYHTLALVKHDENFDYQNTDPDTIRFVSIYERINLGQ